MAASWWAWIMWIRNRDPLVWFSLLAAFFLHCADRQQVAAGFVGSARVHYPQRGSTHRDSHYVRPSEISLERPFIMRHIAATRAAYGIDQRTQEIDFQAQPEQKIDWQNISRCSTTCAFGTGMHFTTPCPVTAIPALHRMRKLMWIATPLSKMRQVLISPRELDLTQ